MQTTNVKGKLDYLANIANPNEYFEYFQALRARWEDDEKSGWSEEQRRGLESLFDDMVRYIEQHREM